jgi:hypothetical protein
MWHNIGMRYHAVYKRSCNIRCEHRCYLPLICSWTWRHRLVVDVCTVVAMSDMAWCTCLRAEGSRGHRFFSLVGLPKCQADLVDGSNSNSNRSRSSYRKSPNISYWFGAVTTLYKSTSWSPWQYELRRRSAVAWLLGLRVRISLWAVLFAPMSDV